MAMDTQRIIKFLRYTIQGVTIAAWGTMGLTPSWGSFILGLIGFCIAFALLTFETGE